MTADQFQRFGQLNVYLLLPVGAHDQQTDNVVSVVDDDAIRSVMDSFDPDSPLLVDFNHASIEGGSSEAAGWVVDLFADGRGVWAKIHWSDTGMAAVLNARYRFLSAYCEVENLSSDVCQPVKIVSASLTNDPGLPVPPLITFDGQAVADENEDEDSELENDEIPPEQNPSTLEYLKLRPMGNRLRNRGNSDWAKQMIDSSWKQTSSGEVFNEYLELLNLLGLPDTADPDEVKLAINKRTHAPRIARRRRSPEENQRRQSAVARFSNRVEPVNWVRRHNQTIDRLCDQLCANRSSAEIRALAVQHPANSYMKKTLIHRANALTNRGSSIRGANEPTGTRNEPFAGPVKHSPESIYAERPKPRLSWKVWGNGMPTFDENEQANRDKMNAMCDRMCKGKSSRAIRILANQFQQDFFMRSALSKRADRRSEEERARRENFSNRNGKRPFRPLGASASMLLNR